MVDPKPGDGNVRHLKAYWAYGEGAAKWRGSPKPWTTLNTLLSKYVKSARVRNGLTTNIMKLAGVSWTESSEGRAYKGLANLKPEHKAALRKAAKGRNRGSS